jgi:hypothetical protein
MAKSISDKLLIGGWPTFILIDEKGKILVRDEGYSSGRIKGIKKYTRWLSKKQAKKN